MEEHYSIIDGKYVLKSTLGSGATCKVKLAQVKDTDDFVAVKILNPNSTKVFKQETENLKLINHKNIINLLEEANGLLDKKDGSCKQVEYIVLEYAAYGELFDYLFFPKKGFNENIARYIFAQLLDGLEACHNAGIAHRDLKSDNIMVAESWIPKIADFGFSAKLEGKDGKGGLRTYAGTSFYMAPEIQYHRTYNGVQVDIFSMGVILFSLVTAKLPFEKALTYDKKYRYIVQGNYDAYWTVMQNVIPPVSEEFKSLINLLLAYDATTRPSIQEIRNHAWMKLEIPTDEDVFLEFEDRKKSVSTGKKIQQQEEKEKKKQNKPRRVYKSGEQALFNLINNEGVKRECKKFAQTGNPYYVEFSGTDPENIINQLNNFFEQGNVLPTVQGHEKHPRFTVTHNINQEKADDGSEDVEQTAEFLEIVLDLTEVDSQSYRLEFIKNEGSKWEFVNLYDALKDFLEKNISA